MDALSFLDTQTLSDRKRHNWMEFFSELRQAVAAAEGRLLRQWASESLATSLGVLVRRVENIIDLARRAASSLRTELARMVRAILEGRFIAYLRDLLARIWRRLRSAWHSVNETLHRAWSWVRAIPSMPAEELVSVAADVSAAVIGFFIAGGGGDGGLVDLDWTIAGTHRSFLFHSAFTGIAFEAMVLSFFRLVEILHGYLPRRHSPVWDRILVVGRRYANLMVAGGWAGVATHLVVDAHVDGWTPYKDLPIALPAWGHKLVMDVNAAASGWIGWHFYDKIGRKLKRNGDAVRKGGLVWVPEGPGSR